MHKTRTHLMLALLIASCALGCSEEPTPQATVEPTVEPIVEPEIWEWGLPDGVPAPDVPQDNPMTQAKVELGRHLFYDTRLSENQTQSCSSCHVQALAFTDDKAVPTGSTGQNHSRSSMALANVAYTSTMMWANPVVDTLEQQALLPLFGTQPVELGMADREDELLERLAQDPLYQDLFERAFGAPGPSVDAIAKALAAFQRSLLSFDSPYNRYISGDDDAMSAPALRGMDLFFSERTECFHCHGGFTLSGSVTHESTVFQERPFHNTGLYALDNQGSYPEPNVGLFEFTQDPKDMGRFKAPSLRNVAVTAPYMHDGSIEDLDGVLNHYTRGGRLIEQGPLAGDGSTNPNKSTFVQGFVLTQQERDDLIAFLNALTDETFLNDPRHATPWPKDQ